MEFEIKMPKLSDSMEKGTIIKWLKTQGEKVEKGDPLLEISTGKVNMEVEAEVSGLIKEILKKEGEEIAVDTPIAIIECSKEDIEAPPEVNAVDTSYFGSLLHKKKEKKSADICIIGGGPGGYVAAIRASQLGAKVILVEKDELGGSCLNRGCIPTKALVRSAEILDNIQNAGVFGIDVKEYKLDYAQVIKRKNEIVSMLARGIESLLKKNRVEIVKGKAKIEAKDTITVEGIKTQTQIGAANTIIATGSKPLKLPIKGIDSPNVITSDEILTATSLPNSIVIVGGGVIGMEFAFILNSFGVEVVVVELMENILPNIDEDASNLIRKIAESKGIKILTGTQVEEIQEVKNGGNIVIVNQNESIKNIYGEKVFISVGRKFTIEGLGLEEVGIELDRGAIKVNDFLETTLPNVYAVGDVNGGIMLAHVASEEGITAVENIMGNKHKMDYSVIPSAIFTNPEVAVIGLSEKQAVKEGYKIKVGMFPLSANGKALTLGKKEGFVKIIAAQDNKILGACIVGPHATAMIHEIAVAMKNHLTVKQLAKTIHAHPTTAETIMESALASLQQAIHF